MPTGLFSHKQAEVAMAMAMAMAEALLAEATHASPLPTAVTRLATAVTAFLAAG